MENLVARLDPSNIDFFLLGDMNVNMASTNYDSNVHQLTNIADIYGLCQLISEPPRITDRSSTLIDIIFTNCPERVVWSGVAHISISDHSLVYAFRKLSINFRKGHSSITYRNFNHNNIYNENWEYLGSALDPNQMWAEWKTKFLQLVDKHAPIRTKRIRSKNSPCITADLKERMHNHDRFKIKAMNSNDPHDWANFKRMRNKVNTEIKAAKELFYNKFIEANGDPHKTWQIINDLKSRKAANPSIREINLNGISISESSDLSNAFNDHFSSIGPKLANEIPLSNNNGHCHQKYVKSTNNRLEFHPTNSEQILKLLNKLNKSKGAGLDKLSNQLIRECADLILPYISTIFNSCLTTGIFPDDWKLAKVTPIFKWGDRSDMDNYCPISVISPIAKVFERIVYNQLSSYSSENNILSQHQSGFRSFHSTVTALLEATDNWAFNIDRGYVNAVVFLDL